MADKVWPNALERGEFAEKLLKEQLNFNEVEVCVNWSKAKIIEKLTELKEKAMTFQKAHYGGKETLVICIVSVGNRIDPFIKEHKILLQEFEVEVSGQNEGDYEDFFELTHDGEILNLNEQACWIADTREFPLADADIFNSNVHTICINDYQGFAGRLGPHHIHKDGGMEQATKDDFDKLDLVKEGRLENRMARNNVTFAAATRLEIAYDYFKTQREVNQHHVFQFPEVCIRASMQISVKKWPKERQ